MPKSNQLLQNAKNDAKKGSSKISKPKLVSLVNRGK